MANRFMDGGPTTRASIGPSRLCTRALPSLIHAIIWPPVATGYRFSALTPGQLSSNSVTLSWDPNPTRSAPGFNSQGILSSRRPNNTHVILLVPPRNTARGCWSLRICTSPGGSSSCLKIFVPRAYELGTNILRQLELPPGEVQIRKDQQPRAVFLGGTSSMTCVLFGRRLDNIPCELNPGALRVGFGPHERVTLLELNWPAVKAEKRYPVATGGQIMAWIREGRARVQSLDGPIEARVVGPPSIKRLAIKGIRLHYSSFILESEGGEEKPADRLYPYAVLDTEAEFGPGDIETFPLICPVVPEGLPPVSHESLGFSIYPSKHNQRSKLAPSEPTTQ